MRKLLFFHAPWCSPCRFYDREIITPLEKSIGAEHIVRVDAQIDPFMAEKYGIDKLPAFVILDDSIRVMQSTGGYTTDQLLMIMNEGGEGD